MAARPLIDLEAITVRRAEEQMKDLTTLKAEMAVPSDRGELHHSAKLDAESVREIRLRLEHWTDSEGVVHFGEPVRALAREYGIDPKTLRRIRDRKIWTSVP